MRWHEAEFLWTTNTHHEVSTVTGRGRDYDEQFSSAIGKVKSTAKRRHLGDPVLIRRHHPLIALCIQDLSGVSRSGHADALPSDERIVGALRNPTASIRRLVEAAMAPEVYVVGEHAKYEMLSGALFGHTTPRSPITVEQYGGVLQFDVAVHLVLNQPVLTPLINKVKSKLDGRPIVWKTLRGVEE